MGKKKRGKQEQHDAEVQVPSAGARKEAGARPGAEDEAQGV